MVYYPKSTRVSTENKTVGDIITDIGNYLWNLEIQTIIDVVLLILGGIVVLAMFVTVAGIVLGLLQAWRENLVDLWQSTFDKETPNDWRIYFGWGWPIFLVLIVAMGVWFL